MDTCEQDYMLGYSGREADRLVEQAAFIEDLTEEMLCRAGIQPGMRVLDVGCGVGDVSLLAARLVGPTGSIVGFDRAATSVETARRRAAGAGVANVRFHVADVNAYDAHGQVFDAVIGRVVLMYLPEPATVLRQLSRCVRPGGVVAFQEIDISHATQVPHSTLFDNVTRWVSAAFRAGGAEPEMGGKLAATFMQAGLPRPTMIASARVESGAQSSAYRYVAEVVRSVSPLIEQSGAATLEEIDVDTLAERLRDDALASERVTYLQRFVGAWSRVEGARS